MDFPLHNIDPKKKGKDWCLQMSKAIWNDFSNNVPKTMFYHYAAQYDGIKSYAHGRQSTTNYKKTTGVDEQTNTSWQNLDYKVVAAVKRARQTALGLLQKSDYNIVATPIDALARDEADSYYAGIKAKILLRNEIAKQNPELLNNPALMPEQGEPQDLEELEMQMEFGFKHNLAIEAEQGIQLIFNQNNINAARKRVLEDLFDFGVAVYKDSMDSDGKVKFRNCDVKSIITNFCRYEDFRDMLWCGEAVDMTFHDFRQESSGSFTPEQYDEIIDAAKSNVNQVGRNVNYSHNMSGDKGKVRILDLEWFSDNDMVFESRVDKRGNKRFERARYVDEDKDSDKISRKRIKVVYKAKWIIGTEFIYDFGLVNYMKRNKKLSNTELSFHIVATNFYEMTAKGVMEDLIPIADQVQIAWLKLQHIRNSLLPFLIRIDLDALENVALGKGGEAMSPKELLDMMFQTGIMVTRTREIIAGDGVNYKPVEYVQTNYGQAISEAWNDLKNNLMLIQEVTGLNDLTDGSTPNPKMLTTTANMGYEASKNAFYSIQFAEKQLLLKLAGASFCRLRRAIKMGKVEGWIPALGSNTMKFITVSPDVDLHEYGIVLEDKPSQEQKGLLMQDMLKASAEGTIDVTDRIIIENTQNLKQAEQILAYRIKKRKAQMQQEALAMQQQNGQIQIQSAQAASQMKLVELQEASRLKKEEIDLEKNWAYKIKELELSVKVEMNTENNDTKVEIADSKPAPSGV